VSGKRLVAALVAFGGGTAFTACLLALAAGMRDVMRTDGGFCASGGPYVIAHQCSAADIHLIMAGIFGALIAAAFYAGGSAGLGSKAASAGLLLWAALFGTLGWNFVSAGRAGASGMLFTGVLFLVMAAGGLIPVLARLARDLRRPAVRPDPVIPGMQPLVRAAVPAFPGRAAGAGHHVPARRGAGRAADAGHGARGGHGIPGGRPGHRTAADRGLADRQPGGHRPGHRAQHLADQRAAMTG
jgi:hypothetical protein